MKNANQKYFAYLRKSSEDKEKQALSIPAQRAQLTEYFKGLDIEFVEEEKSAFTPYNRPLFADMLQKLAKGERAGLLAWSPDRVSRNEIDAAALTYMLRENKITLRFATYHFENNPSGIWMLQMALSTSQFESAKKGQDVKRGLHQKAKNGMFPNRAPIGYVNSKHDERGKKQIYPDPLRLPLVRKMFDLLLDGSCSSVQQVLKVATDEWSFRMPNGKKISRSTLYYAFSNRAYAGWYEYPPKSGEWHKGNYKAIITDEEFDRLQSILGRHGKPRPKSLVFEFTGMMRCGECNAAITAELKMKHQKNGNTHRYVYYHCTKRKDPNCTQGSIEETELKKQIVAEINSLVIPPEFHAFAMKWFKVQHQKEIKKREAMRDTQQHRYTMCLRKIDGLVDMRANGEITPEVFAESYEPLQAEKKELELMFKNIGASADTQLKKNDEMLTFIEQASLKFETGTLETKRRILNTLGSNLVLKDKKLFVDIEKSLFPMKRVAKTVGKIKKRLEPIDSVEKQADFEEACSTNTILLPD